MTPFQYYRATMLRQLERLVRLRLEYNEQLNGYGVKLLDRCITATYGDCVFAGIGWQARDVMRKLEKAS